MKRALLDRNIPAIVPALLSLLFAGAGILQYAGFLSEKYLAIAAGVGILLLLAVGDLRRLMNWPSLLLMGYAAFSMVTLIWAMSGKFFLQRYSNIFVSVFFFLLVVLWKRSDKRFVRHVLALLVLICTLYALIGLEGAATHYSSVFLYNNPDKMNMVRRLNGIFHNSNIEASFYAMGILLSTTLICDGERRPLSRAIWSMTLAINSVAMVLGISLGAIASLAGGVIVYLLVSGKGRATALLRLAEGLIPAAVCAVMTVPHFNAETKPELPLVLTLAAAAVTALLELNFIGKLSSILERYQKAVMTVVLAGIALALGFAWLALRLDEPYVFGESLTRGTFLPSGTHTIVLDADGPVDFKLVSRSKEDIMAGYSRSVEMDNHDYSDSDSTELAASGQTFTVPEDSVICTFTFQAEKGVTLRSVTIDGNRKLMMKYRLLPGFVANRLQGGLTANSSYIIREALWKYGIRLFRLSPLAGNGVGSFETGITRVQDSYFATRYVHQHYIQVLLECGLIGFALYAGALAAMVIALAKKLRRMQRSDPYFWIVPGLCAEMAMNGLQMLWDVSMSIMAFLACTYAVYALIVTTCSEPIAFLLHSPAAAPQPEEAEGEAEADENTPRGPAPVPTGVSFPTRAIAMLIPAIYVLSVIGNLYAARLVSREFASYDEAYETMEQAVRLDLYERNDIMLTYVLLSVQDTRQDNHISRANVYANELSKVQSNTLPYFLTGYFFNTMQYERAIEEAKLGATYSASDKTQWNNIVGMLKQGFIDSGRYSPLLTMDNGPQLVEGLAEYGDMLDGWNAKSPKPIKLTNDNQAFFDTVRELEKCNGDKEAMRAILAPQAQAEKPASQ